MKKTMLCMAMTAAILGTTVSATEACTTFIVGRKASVDGDRIIGRTVDSVGIKGVNLVTVPARKGKGTWSFKDEKNGFTIDLPVAGCQHVIAPCFPSHHMGVYAESCQNEYGVCISATETIRANEQAVKADPYVKNGIAESSIPTLLIPYVKTAREGVERLGNLIAKYGCSSAEAVIFADDKETWYMEYYTGHQWAALKVPEDCYAVIGNDAILDFADLQDSDNVMASPEIWSMAKEHGFLRKENGKPHLAKTYGAELRDYSQIRNWAGRRFFSPSTAGEYNVKKRYSPFEKPERKIALKELMDLSRYRFEDTKYDANIPGSKTRPIGIERAAQCHFFQLRENKPTIFWLALSSSEFAPYLPIYANLNAVPAAWLVDSLTYTEDSAYWRFRGLHSLATIDRKEYGNVVREHWNAFENKLLSDIPAMDAKYAKGAYSGAAAAEIFAEISERALADANTLRNIVLTELSKDVVDKTGRFGYDKK